MTNIFEYAVKNAVRFTSRKGNLTTEDLWKLSQHDLNEIFKGLQKTLKENTEEGLFNECSVDNVDVQVKSDIVKHVFLFKKAEQEAKVKKAEHRSQIAQMEDLIVRKKQAALEGKSIEELEGQLKQLREEMLA